MPSPGWNVITATGQGSGGGGAELAMSDHDTEILRHVL